MQKLVIKTGKPELVQADIYIRSAYKWGPGWTDKKDAEAFNKEIVEQLSFGDFTKWQGEPGAGSKLVSTKDERQYVYCHPMVMGYVGTREGLAQLEEKMRNNRFDSFFYIKTEGVRTMYDLTKEELAETLEANRDVIRNNIKERVSTKPGSDQDRVIDDVFNEIRIINMAERNHLFDSPQELSYQKTVEVFNSMVKNKEIILDKELHVLPARARKVSLRPPVRKATQEKGVGRGD